jgi:hypothetical protein
MPPNENNTVSAVEEKYLGYLRSASALFDVGSFEGAAVIGAGEGRGVGDTVGNAVGAEVGIRVGGNVGMAVG